MGLTIARADVKRKSRIGVMDYDSDIDALIAELKPVIEYSIADRYLNDSSNAGLQATLNLGALEIVSGEFMAQLLREEGASEQITVGDITIGDRPQRNRLVDLADPYGLKAQGMRRLQPYLKAKMAAQSQAPALKRSADAVFTDDAMSEW